MRTRLPSVSGFVFATVLFVSSTAAADVCEGLWQPIPAGGIPNCPAKNSCWSVDPPEHGLAFVPHRQVDLDPRCDYQNVHFKISRRNTTFDCHGATLVGPSKGAAAGHMGIKVQAMEPVDLSNLPDPGGCGSEPLACTDFSPVEGVTVRNCTLLGYENAVHIEPSGAVNKQQFQRIYLAWFDHLNERRCRLDQIEQCLLRAGPRKLRFENVHTKGGQAGFTLFGHISETTITRSSVVDADSVGVYLSPGARNNVIEHSTFARNYREGIALDSAADNIIRDNYFENNGARFANEGWGVWPLPPAPGREQAEKDRRRSAITVFKNFWESKSPRNQHASGNLIDHNIFFNQGTGVFIGYRQDVEADDSDRDPVYLYSNGLHMRERAEDTYVQCNHFANTRLGVVVRDDGAAVRDNMFTGNGEVGVLLGSKVRMLAREPVWGAIVTGNSFSTSAPACAHPSTFDTSPPSPAGTIPRSIYSEYCPVGNEISDNSFGGAGPSSAGCDASRAAILGSYAQEDGSFEAQSATGRAAFFEPGQTWLSGNFDGQGGDDVLNLVRTEEDGRRLRMWLHASSSSKRFAHKTSFQTFPLALPERGFIPEDGKWVAGNFDGQGGDDLVYLFRKDSGTCLLAWYSFGQGFMFHGDRSDPSSRITNAQCFPISSVPYDPSHEWLAATRNRDGLADLVHIYREGAGNVVTDSYESTDGWRFRELSAAPQFMGALVPATRWLMGDFNGDGRSDLARIFANDLGQATAGVRVGRSTSFAPEFWVQTFASSTRTPATFSPAQRWIVANFNGDEYDDLVFVYGRRGEARVWRSVSNGAHFDHAGLQTLGAFSDDQRWLTGRFNGDARGDLLRVFGKRWD